MAREDALKLRAVAYDEALRVERARANIEALNKALDAARKEYNEAGEALRQARTKADAAESESVAEEARTSRLIDAVEAIKA